MHSCNFPKTKMPADAPWWRGAGKFLRRSCQTAAWHSPSAMGAVSIIVLQSTIAAAATPRAFRSPASADTTSLTMYLLTVALPLAPPEPPSSRMAALGPIAPPHFLDVIRAPASIMAKAITITGRSVSQRAIRGLAG